MTFKQKRKLKSIGKRYLIMGYLMIPTFAIPFILLVNRGKDTLTDTQALCIVLTLMTFFMLGLVFNGISQSAQAVRKRYIKRIYKIRENIRVNLILDATYDLDVTKAAKLYNEFKFNPDIDRFLVGHIATLKLYSLDAGDVAKAKLVFDNIRKIYSVEYSVRYNN